MGSTGFFPHFFFFLGILMAGILYGLSVFAFGSPKAFAEWFRPFYWLTQSLKVSKVQSVYKFFSFSCGAVLLTFLLILQFLLGGFFVTGVFNLYHSPFAFFFGGPLPL